MGYRGLALSAALAFGTGCNNGYEDASEVAPGPCLERLTDKLDESYYDANLSRRAVATTDGIDQVLSSQGNDKMCATQPLRLSDPNGDDEGEPLDSDEISYLLDAHLVGIAWSDQYTDVGTAYYDGALTWVTFSQEGGKGVENSKANVYVTVCFDDPTYTGWLVVTDACETIVPVDGNTETDLIAWPKGEA